MVEYKSPYSNTQFNILNNNNNNNNINDITAINDTDDNNNINDKDINIIARLISLTMKRFNTRLYEKVCNILKQNTTDDIIYNELCILYNSYNNRIHKSIKRPNKNAMIISILILRLKHFMKFEFEKKPIINYLDVGAGNGRFCKMLGKELQLENQNIHGIDIPSFSEQGDWNRNQNQIMNDIVFITINKNDKYPYPDNKFNIITMKMVLHHIENIELTLSEISRVLCNNGYLIIIEHDVNNSLDYMLCEIEHLYYIKVFNKDNKDNKDKKDKKDIKEDNFINGIEGDMKDIDNLGYIKFRSLKETNNILSKFGFDDLDSDFFYENNVISPTRNYWTIYQLNK
jgi:ubiquinone/menaquinone biosynthesis C-methylase UbiE